LPLDRRRVVHPHAGRVWVSLTVTIKRTLRPLKECARRSRVMLIREQDCLAPVPLGQVQSLMDLADTSNSELALDVFAAGPRHLAEGVADRSTFAIQEDYGHRVEQRVATLERLGCPDEP
jgi:hypothetical protein